MMTFLFREQLAHKLTFGTPVPFSCQVPRLSYLSWPSASRTTCSLLPLASISSMVIMVRLFLALVGVMVSSPTVVMGVKVSPKIQLGDTASLVDPSQWYDASQHIDWWVDFGRQWQGPTDLYGIDLFGGLHGRVQQAFQKRGFRCGCYDIARREGVDNDITSYGGFCHLVLLGLRLQHGSLITMGPPCSLFVWLSSSVHLRSLFGPFGDPNHVGTQMANAIARNTVLWLIVQFPLVYFSSCIFWKGFSFSICHQP